MSKDSPLGEEFLTSVAKFGCFDLDAIFSAAFVFVMAELLNSGSAAAELQRAGSLLRQLEKYGNKAASNRLGDVQQMCSRLEISVELLGDTDQGCDRMERRHEPENVEADLNLSDPSWTNPPWNGLEELLSGDLSELFSNDEQTALLDPYQHNDFSLDGTVETDWGEFERIASQF